MLQADIDKYFKFLPDHDSNKTILFIKCGDFYYALVDHAVKVVQVVDLTLTTRNGVTCVGVPAHLYMSVTRRLQNARYGISEITRG